MKYTDPCSLRFPCVSVVVSVCFRCFQLSIFNFQLSTFNLPLSPHGVVEEVLIGKADAVLEFGFVCPPECSSLADVE